MWPAITMDNPTPGIYLELPIKLDPSSEGFIGQIAIIKGQRLEAYYRPVH